jgi:D-alanine-D-alanine ligase
MKKLRVLVVCHEELVPPDSIEGLSDHDIAEWRTEFDVVSALHDLGHAVRVLGVGDDIGPIEQVASEVRPHVCFNMLVEFHGAAVYDQHVASHLELLRLNYTGCNPRGLTLARDTALSKMVLAHHGVRVPAFCVLRRGKNDRRPPEIEFPLFVKSLNEEASLGISQASIVHDDEQLTARAEYVHEKVGTDAIAEEFVEGREFYVGVIGNKRLSTFPIWELCMPNLPEGAPLIATRRVKWDIDYQRQIGVKNRRAEELSARKEREIAAIAKAAYRHLGLSGYARMDLRMGPDGRAYVLVANPNPDLTYGEDFAESAHEAGISYERLIQRILKLGIEYQAEWKHYARSQ